MVPTSGTWSGAHIWSPWRAETTSGELCPVLGPPVPGERGRAGSNVEAGPSQTLPSDTLGKDLAQTHLFPLPYGPPCSYHFLLAPGDFTGTQPELGQHRGEALQDTTMGDFHPTQQIPPSPNPLDHPHGHSAPKVSFWTSPGAHPC